ncbi:hypothetical protein BBU72A_D0012 (plasmid) [Borreliella burgdorferi 72a]|nr:hypothetical protein BBU72A_D0012 [Borreliella burgdorferi 72a]
MPLLNKLQLIIFINKIKFLKLLIEFIIGIEFVFFKVIVLN